MTEFLGWRQLASPLIEKENYVSNTENFEQSPVINK
jgi:hypothetical protein